MEIKRVPRITEADIAACDFSFSISEVIAKPYHYLTMDQPIATISVPARKKSYGFAEEYFDEPGDVEKAILALIEPSDASSESKGRILGYAFAFKDWNGMATLNTIALDASLRGKGQGKKLFAAVVEWARELGVKGIRVETQSNNVAACRFYKKQGLAFGGYDEFLYRAIDERKMETALYWYYMLDGEETDVKHS